MSWKLCHNWESWIVILGVLLTSFVAEGAIRGWKKTPTQYHIQTDEGNERYFRYQTYNGQYRKERRLDDGTVIGSYGWVDPAGFLRMTDYVADSKGYRVVKEFMEYVGTNSILQEEKPTKVSAPPKYSPSTIRHSTKVSKPHQVIFKPPPTPPRAVQSNLSSKNNGNKIKAVFSATAVTPPPNTFRPPKLSSKPVVVVYGPIKKSRFGNKRPIPGHKLINSETETEEGVGEKAKKEVFKNYTTPLRRDKAAGFIYKIPNQYHKEETSRDGSREGSFGYVDPFGIRRVIHYKAGNKGFEANRDFKYVGRQY